MRRRALLVLATCCVASLAIELGAAVIYWIGTGEMFSYAGVERMQVAAAAAGDEVASPAGDDENSEQNEKQKQAAFRDIIWRQFNTPHPYLGFVCSQKLNKNEHGIYNHEFGISKFGFVDDKDPIHRRGKDKVIIGIVGGSVALGFGSEGGAKTIAADLSQHPRFRDKEMVFVRMGLGGYKQPQQLLVITYLLSLGAQFDYLINLDGFNEIALPGIEIVNSGAYPFFPRGWQYLAGEILSREQQKLIGMQAFAESDRVDFAKSFLSMPTKYSVTLQLIWRLRDQSLARSIADATHSLANYKPEESPFVLTGPGTDGFGGDVLHARLAAQWRDASIQLQRLCEANGIHYLHFLQPNQYVAGSKPMGDKERSEAIEHDGLYAAQVRKGYPAMIAEGSAIRAAGVDYHDLTRLFVDCKDPLYVDTCCHVNELGNQIMGHRVARALADAADRHDVRSAKVVRWSITPADLFLTNPFVDTSLRLKAEFADGSSRVVTPVAIGASIVAANPAIVSVSESGVLRGLSPGRTELSIRGSGVSMQLPVRVRFAQVVSFGKGLPGAGGHTPVLTVSLDSSSGQLEMRANVSSVVGGASGGLFVTTKPLRFSGEGLLLPEGKFNIAMVCNGVSGRAGVGTATIEAPPMKIDAVRRSPRVVYCQAAFRDPASTGGWSVSNALRLEVR